MKIRAQIAMVMNLDKCIGCHTCSVTCKNVWTSRQGMEYAWFNNVETKPGIGYPKDWENQQRWRGGWQRKKNGKIIPKQGGRLAILAKIFANPNLPEIDDYYEPFTYDYAHLQHAPELPTTPVARPLSLVTGRPMDKIEWGPNWEELLGGEFDRRSRDYNFEAVQKDIYGQFENSFMMYCRGSASIASIRAVSPRVPRDRFTSVRRTGSSSSTRTSAAAGACASPAVPTKRSITTGPRARRRNASSAIRASRPDSRRCARKPVSGASAIWASSCTTPTASNGRPRPKTRRTSTRRSCLDPNDPEIDARARSDGVPDAWIDAAKRSPTYKMAVDWRIAFPLHPEYRTLPMVWYVPPLSPIQAHANAGAIESVGDIPDVRSLRIPVRYLANLLTAGAEAPIVTALERMLAMRVYFRRRQLGEGDGERVLAQAGLTVAQVEEMHRYLSIANYEDRFVIPTSHRETAEDAYGLKGSCGFTFGNGCDFGPPHSTLFGGKMGRRKLTPIRHLDT